MRATALRSIGQHHFSDRAILPRYRMPGLHLVFCLLDMAALHGIMTVWALQGGGLYGIGYYLNHDKVNRTIN